MKKFTKLFLSCAIVSAMAVTAASSAFAAPPESVPITGDLTGTATIGTSGVTITELKLPEGTTVAAESEVTFLVFKGVTDVATDASNVEGIDQNTYTDTVVPTNNGLKSAAWVENPGAEDVTTYTVMVGYTDSADSQFKTASGTFTLTENVGTEFMLGEVDGLTGFTSNDATCVLVAASSGDGEKGDANKEIVLLEDLSAEGLTTIPAGKTIKLGEVDGMTGYTSNDATCVLVAASHGDAETGFAGMTVKAKEAVASPAE